MPGVSTNMKNVLGQTLALVRKALVKIEKTHDEVIELAGSSKETAALATLLGKDTVDGSIAKLEKRQEALDVGGLDDSRYKTLRDDIAKAAQAVTKLGNRLIAEKKDAENGAWKQRVVDKNGRQADLSGFDKTLLGVLEKIVSTNGRGDHGDTSLGGSHGSCLHWVSGKARIFGKMKSGQLVLIGTGFHTGSTNAEYKVDLLLGGKTTATIPSK